MPQSYGKLHLPCKFFSKKNRFPCFLECKTQKFFGVFEFSAYICMLNLAKYVKNNTYKRYKQWRIKTILKRINCKLSLLRK